MDIEVIVKNLPLYLQGLWMTVQLVALALAAGLALAVPISLLAASRQWFLAIPAKVYIYVFRGTPLLVQMYIIYYGLAQFEVVRESFLWPVLREAYWCALLSFALNTAGYTGEILRGAIANTPHGEIEAARSVGMSVGQIYRRIVLPSAFRRALPAYGNEVIFMLHGSALAGVITLVDLFGAARIVSSRHFVPFEAFVAAGVFYLCLTFIITWLFKLWERRWHIHLRPRDVTGAPPPPTSQAPGASTPGLLPGLVLALVLCSAGVQTPRAQTLRAEPAPASNQRLSFAALGWHPPQNGAQALARFRALDISPELRRSADAHFVPKGEFVFVLKAGERVPEFDCDPGAGQLFIEFVFAPDGPIIFTPAAGGGYCQMGFGIALEVGRTLEIEQTEWGDATYPKGTIRITDQGLEYAR